MGLLQEVFGLRRKKEEAAAATFHELARQVADGAKVAAKDVDAKLVSLGKMPEDLAAAVERLQRRGTAFAAVKAARDVPAERDAIQAAVKAAEAEYGTVVDAAVAKLRSVTHPAEARLRQLEKIERDGRTAESFLRDTADPAIAERIRELRQRADGVKQRIADEVTQAGTKDYDARTAGTVANLRPSWNNPGLTSGQHQAAQQAKSDALAAEVEQHHAAAERIRADELAPLEADIGKLEAQLLQP